MCHPEMLLPIPKIDDPVERFVAVVKFYLSGWHIRPPYAPFLHGRPVASSANVDSGESRSP